LVTDADQAWLQRWAQGRPIESSVRGQKVRKWWSATGLTPGDLYFRTNRFDYLEIGIHDGGGDSANRASRLLGVRPGDALELRIS
jgi:hypothetical protein